MLQTASVCPPRVRVFSPVVASHSLIVLSKLPLTIRLSEFGLPIMNSPGGISTIFIPIEFLTRRGGSFLIPTSAAPWMLRKKSDCQRTPNPLALLAGFFVARLSSATAFQNHAINPPRRLPNGAPLACGGFDFRESLCIPQQSSISSFRGRSGVNTESATDSGKCSAAGIYRLCRRAFSFAHPTRFSLLSTTITDTLNLWLAGDGNQQSAMFLCPAMVFMLSPGFLRLGQKPLILVEVSQ